VTLHDFFVLPEGPPYFEFEDGNLIPMPRPHPRHQSILMRLASRLDGYCQTHSIGSIWPEIEIVLSGQPRVYIPDLVFLNTEHLAALPQESSRFHVVPDMVVEILSPSTRKRDRSTKMKAYRAAGVPWYWLVEEDDLTMEELELTERGYLVAQTTTAGHTFTPALFPELTIDLAALMGETVTPEEDEEDAV
jgi:Uma2 family endonuclease